MPDTIGSFRALAEGFVPAGPLSGAIGAATAVLTSQLPFHIGFKLPFELTYGDTLRLPIALVNNTPEGVTAQLHVSHLDEGLHVTDQKGKGVGSSILPRGSERAT